MFHLISIHASREGSDLSFFIGYLLNKISIHASREGSDRTGQTEMSLTAVFQSTLPARDATLPTGYWACMLAISIHASREGSDPIPLSWIGNRVYFNPRFPRGKRLPNRRQCASQQHDFNPRFPRGKRLITGLPETGGDYFNPRFPRGKRPS